MKRARTWSTDARERFLASDPGLTRLLSGLSAVCAVLLTLGVLTASDASVPILVTGALTAMVSTVAVTEPHPRDQALTLATGGPVALAVIAAGSALAPYRVVADVVFVLLIFAAIYIRRLGRRATTLGVFAFELFFVTQFVETRVDQLPQLSLAVLVAFACSALVRFTILRSPPERTLRRLRRAFELRLAQLLDALIGVVEAVPGTTSAERAADSLRRHAARMHTSALMIHAQLGTGTLDERSASAIQRRVVEAETAVERLAVLVLRVLRPGADIDTLSRHLAPPRPAGPAVDARDTAALRSLLAELRALRAGTGLGSPRPTGPDHDEVRNRLLGYRAGERLPDASPAMRDVFRAVGDLTCALLGLHVAPDAQTPEIRGTPEDSSRAESTPPKPRSPRIRPTTRTAFQVATGSALAIVGGELLSPQRWYWAVFTCWMVFISTASTGEILVRGYRRLIGTVAGVVVGLGLAALTSGTPWLAFSLACLSVFGMFYAITASYALMSFFVTTMIGMLYTLLHALTPGVLVVRIEETALGIACGLVAALLVMPVRTQDRTDQLLCDALERLRAVLSQSLAQLRGESGGDPLGSARALDEALDSLRVSAQPQTTQVSLLRSRRRRALAVLGLVETAAFHARSLAATVGPMPAGLDGGADPHLVRETRRIDRNLATLISHVARGDEDGTPFVRGPGDPTRPEQAGSGARPEDIDPMRRVRRHLHRVDENVQALARTLHLPVRDGL
ncbi:FUSC family protein [Streptomyces sp. NPDC004539]|uniref:FUSC family protein n=1 Tax=Streptomyces sp. NPDC004539 TaxID=3154280 RepID=UPI00339F2B6E